MKRGIDEFSAAVCLLMAAALGVAVAISLIRLSRARKKLEAIKIERMRLGRVCPHCGYDVRAALKPDASGLCAECGGEVFPPEK